MADHELFVGGILGDLEAAGLDATSVWTLEHSVLTARDGREVRLDFWRRALLLGRDEWRVDAMWHGGSCVDRGSPQASPDAALAALIRQG
ncbi:hypothetical protein [Streptacidiphilus cavernicola]|uniref:Uncharacterized protein n=1 Tax=Streptacidiphilus cavernicola TaxID=3342716 RepID=A0ABV6VYX7_9ACTN